MTREEGKFYRDKMLKLIEWGKELLNHPALKKPEFQGHALKVNACIKSLQEIVDIIDRRKGLVTEEDLKRLVEIRDRVANDLSFPDIEIV